MLGEEITYQNKTVVVYAGKNIYKCPSIGIIDGDIIDVNSKNIYCVVWIFDRYAQTERLYKEYINEFIEILELTDIYDNELTDDKPDNYYLYNLDNNNKLMYKKEGYDPEEIAIRKPIVAEYNLYNTVFKLRLENIGCIKDSIKVMKTFYNLINSVYIRTPELINERLTDYYTNYYDKGYEYYIRNIRKKSAKL